MFLQEEYSMVYFWFYLRDGCENFENLRLNLSNCNHLHPYHPQQQRAVNSLNAAVKSSLKKVHHYF